VTTSARKVLITGVGVHGGLGDGEQTWTALCAGRSALRMVTLPGVSGLPEVPGAPAAEGSPATFLDDRKLLKYMSPTTSMAVLAAGRALEHAGLRGPGREELRAETALFVATGLIAFDISAVSRAVEASCSAEGTLDLQRLGREGLRRSHPLMPFKMLLNMPLGMISIVHGIKGENGIVYPDAGQAGVCLETAVRGIRTGRFCRALVGGTVNGLSLLPLCTLHRLGRLAPSVQAAQPFTEDHNGYAPADCAAFVVLEAEASAQERGALPLARVAAAGCGRTWHTDPRHRVNARARGWRRTCPEEEAPPTVILSGGNLNAAEDRAELEALETVWGQPRVTSLDGRLGHLGPAGPFFSLAVAAQMTARREALLQEGPVPLEPEESLLISSADPDGAFTSIRVMAQPEGAP
jgi:3-oxoacyl-[acyl-carrier-protein] synthase II